MALDSLREGCKTGNYYAPLQAFHSLLARKINGPRRDFGDAQRLILDGIAVSALVGCSPVALDLSKEAINVLKAFDKKFGKEAVTFFQEIEKALVQCPHNTDEWFAAGVHFFEAAFHWAGSTERESDYTDADADWIVASLATAQLQLFKVSSNVETLAKAVRSSTRCLHNPAFVATVLSTALATVRDSEILLVVEYVVLSLARQVESRPSCKDKILHCIKRLVVHCPRLNGEQVKLFVILTRIAEINSSVALKRKALLEVLASPLAASHKLDTPRFVEAWSLLL